METTALTPPTWLERIVRIATPPLAREVVLGDLCETYESPRHYAWEALRTIPFVIASQMRRHLNLPLLLLQLALIQVGFGPLTAASALPLLMLRDAYQPATRPSHRWALRQAVLVAFIGLAGLHLVFAAAQSALAAPAGAILVWLELFIVGPVLLPILCLLRTALIVDSDRRTNAFTTATDLDRAADAFARRMRTQHLLEAGALTIAALFMATSMMPLAVCYGAAALYLLAEHFARPMPDGDLASRRGAFARALAQQHQLRRFLWWLWLAPLLLGLQSRYIQAGLAHGQALHVIAGACGVTLLCFLEAALTREHGGRVHEQIGALEHMREHGA